MVQPDGFPLAGGAVNLVAGQLHPEVLYRHIIIPYGPVRIDNMYSIDYNSYSYSDGYPRVSIVEQNEDEILGPPCPDALDKEAAKHGD